MARRSKVLAVLGTSGVLLLSLTACGGGDGNSTAKFCDLAKQADKTGKDLGDEFANADPKALKKALTNAIDDYTAASKLAPKEIKKDVTTMLDAQSELADILAADDYDLEKAGKDKDFLDLTADKDLDATSKRVDAYLEKTCGIKSTSSDSTDDTTSVATDDTTSVATDDTTPLDTTPLDTTPVDTEATTSSAAVQLDAEVGGTTVGTADDPSVVYAALLTNTTSDPASNLTITFTMFDANGTVVGTGSAYADLILPGEKRAVSGTTSVTAPAAKITATYSGDVGLPYGVNEADVPSGAFEFSGSQLTSDDYSTGALGLLTSSYAKAFDNVDIEVIFRDAAGSIVGGGSDYKPVLANGQVGVKPSAYYQIPGVATFELYASYNASELGN